MSRIAGDVESLTLLAHAERIGLDSGYGGPRWVPVSRREEGQQLSGDREQPIADRMAYGGGDFDPTPLLPMPQALSYRQPEVLSIDRYRVTGRASRAPRPRPNISRLSLIHI